MRQEQRTLGRARGRHLPPMSAQNISPIERKPLSEMNQQELYAWLGMHQEELEDFCTSAQEYVKRRELNGGYTWTDARYHQFFLYAKDLIAGLREMQASPQQVNQDQPHD